MRLSVLLLVACAAAAPSQSSPPRDIHTWPSSSMRRRYRTRLRQAVGRQPVRPGRSEDVLRLAPPVVVPYGVKR